MTVEKQSDRVVVGALHQQFLLMPSSHHLILSLRASARMSKNAPAAEQPGST